MPRGSIALTNPEKRNVIARRVRAVVPMIESVRLMEGFIDLGFRGFR